jgi:hypothetical protein
MKKFIFLFILFPFLSFTQNQIGQDIDGTDEGERSGDAVSINSDGTIVAVGAKWAHVPNTEIQIGRVRVYEIINNSWIQRGQDLLGQSNSCFQPSFGSSVSISEDGNVLAVSDPYYCYGRVYIYKYISNSWILSDYIDSSYDFSYTFGKSISMSADGSVLAIGADNRNNWESTYGVGKVNLYKHINNEWVQIGNTIEGSHTGDRFGSTVSLSSDGKTVAIGAPFYFLGNGYVLVYENINDVWTQVGAVFHGNNDGFGSSVSLNSNGRTLAISELGSNMFSGLVKVYEFSNTQWNQIGNTISSEFSSDYFGNSLSISSNGTILAVGASHYDVEPWSNNDTGLVRVYKYDASNWIQVGEDIIGERNGDRFGFSVALSDIGSTLVVGAPNNNPVYNPELPFQSNTNIGHARVYSIASELALLEVIEDILGNTNGINVTAVQLNSIEGVSGAIDGVDYTTALRNGTFVDSNNPSPAEIQLIIDQVNGALSLDENVLLRFSLYPNPAETQFTIQLNTTSILEKVTVFNTLGQEVLTSKNTTVDTSKLASGSYIVEITTNNGKASKQLIIE